MRHMEKVRVAALYAVQRIECTNATWGVDYDEGMGYIVWVKWREAGHSEDYGMQLVVSEAFAGSHPDLKGYVAQRLAEFQRNAKATE